MIVLVVCFLNSVPLSVPSIEIDTTGTHQQIVGCARQIFVGKINVSVAWNVRCKESVGKISVPTYRQEESFTKYYDPDIYISDRSIVC